MINPNSLYCCYCHNKALNRKILNVDNDKDVYAKVIKATGENWLEVQFDLKDNDGYQAVHFFKINYCPKCGKKLEEKKNDK